MIRAALLAALVAGCGVKAPPRPPLKPGAAPSDPPAAAEPAPATCETCGTGPAPAPAPRTP
jgi:hypothetical protein